MKVMVVFMMMIDYDQYTSCIGGARIDGDDGDDGVHDDGVHDDDVHTPYTSCIGGARMVGRAADKPMLREPRWTTSVGRSCNHFQLSIFCCNQQMI